MTCDLTADVNSTETRLFRATENARNAYHLLERFVGPQLKSAMQYRSRLLDTNVAARSYWERGVAENTHRKHAIRTISQLKKSPRKKSIFERTNGAVTRCPAGASVSTAWFSRRFVPGWQSASHRPILAARSAGRTLSCAASAAQTARASRYVRF